MEKLLTRDKFREGVFERDKYLCVMCGSRAQDAHHIIERRLFQDGGYYLSNGASVCGICHIKCETTEFTVEQVREKANILKKIIPEHLYDDQTYDKWGNIVLPNGNRLRGELFYDESVQKIIAPYLHLFTDKVKYPRTYHLPWSENMNSDDRMLNDLTSFYGKRVIVTEKMDGENTTLYSDYIHARSIDGRSHSSRDWVKNFWSGLKHEIPSGWRLCGENLFARHSIAYHDLPTYFMGFSLWNEKNFCLSWDETQEWFQLLGIRSVPVLYDGIFLEDQIKKLYNKNSWHLKEGYVLRVADSFTYGQFRNSVGKFVRKNHIQTVKHWMYGQEIISNGLKESSL